jgi:hypothetical protein
MQLSIRQATPQDIDAVAEILGEAARWLEEQGMPMWHQDELQPNRIVADVDSGQFFLAECDGVPAGAIRFQLEDRLFWPDVPQDDSVFVHRLAVRRRFAGGEVSSALLLWAIARTHTLGRRYLRLDCEASRARLRAVYILQRSRARPACCCETEIRFAHRVRREGDFAGTRKPK